MADVFKTHVPDITDEKSPKVLAPVSSSSFADEDLVDRKSEKALVRKLDRHLLPVLTLLYLLSFLDRSNVGNARLEGLTTDLKISMICP